MKRKETKRKREKGATATFDHYYCYYYLWESSFFYKKNS